MNKEMMKKAVANKVVDMAINTTKMPNQILGSGGCYFLLGKPNSKFDLTSDDYEELADFMKQK